MSAQPATASRTILYSAPQLDAVLDAMAAGLAARIPAGAPVTLVGVLRRGAPLADRLCTKLMAGHAMHDLARLDLRIQRYADDLSLVHPETRLTEAPGQDTLDLAGRHAVIVDDVLYHGFSLARAVQYLVQKQPEAIRSVVLVDRGIARLPIRADISGLRLDAAPGDIIECHVPPYESEFAIVLCQPRCA